ncbi:Arogenate dehydratase 3 [Linum grandiflorum]
MQTPLNPSSSSSIATVSSRLSRFSTVQCIHNSSRRAQLPAPTPTLRVAYDGHPGAYSEEAAVKAYPNCETVPCRQSSTALNAVELCFADRAVLPLEDHLGHGPIQNYSRILRQRLHIVGQVHLSVNYFLLALPGVEREFITRVMSHARALDQCDRTLTRMGLRRESRRVFNDTAGAAEHVAENNLRDTAAVASSRAADLYGMRVLADGIQDDWSNTTPFLMVAREPLFPCADSRPFRTTVFFAPAGERTSLGKVLGALASRKIVWTYMEPVRMGRSTYVYYVDLEGSIAESRMQHALAEMKEHTSFFRLLGSYPVTEHV